MSRAELDPVWDVLGPFPIHAREQHFLSPAYPLDLSLPIDTTRRYPSSLAHTASASWSQTTADPHGTLRVSHPTVAWDQIRASEGWAGLQHTNVLRGWLSIHPSSTDRHEPLLRTELVQAAFFTVLPPPDSPQRKSHVPEWHYGNVYALERAPAQLIRLPLGCNQPVRYEVIICAPYEIRLFGDPRAYSSPSPILTVSFSVSLQSPPSTDGSIEPIKHVSTHSVAPYIVDGTPFGDAIGVGVQCLDLGPAHWSVVKASVATEPVPFSVSLLDGAPVRIAPTQTRTVPLLLRPSPSRVPPHAKEVAILLLCEQPTSIDHATRTYVLRVTLPLTHVPLWTRDVHVPILATYFFAESMPTIFSVKPPREPIGERRHHEPILALHGAGVDIVTQPFWSDSLPRQKYAWIVMPQGRNAWGLDWHGPSMTDAFDSVSALSRILSRSGTWAEWGFDPDTRVVLLGHSNGGQGAWYMASRWPDRVRAVIPAAGYIKSQAYVPWCMSRFAHFVDPALRAILDSSLTPDDNDLFLGNLVGKPVLALNGGADDNVPPWHTREQVGILKTWDPDADVTHHEDPGRPHWYPEILDNERVQAFLDRVYSSPDSAQKHGFTLTVALPAESGPLNGWQIHLLTTPGILGRVRVTIDSDVSVRTTNVPVLSLDLHVWACRRPDLVIDGKRFSIDGIDGTILFVHDARSSWQMIPRPDPSTVLEYRARAPPQRLQSILSTRGPLTLLVPSVQNSPELSAALRIAHALLLFHALDAQILSVDQTNELPRGNLVAIGCAGRVERWFQDDEPWKYVDGAWHVAGRRLARPSSAILFCRPRFEGVALFVESTDLSGLERAVRLFPIRTGVLSPDWLVVDGRADVIGAAGVEGAGVYRRDRRTTRWLWNERMSWLD